jgi:hypothetical protein
MSMNARLLGICIFICTFVAVCRAGDPLTNTSILDAHKLGISDTELIATIKTANCAFVISADTLGDLKNAGISDAVIQAMSVAMVPVVPAAADTVLESRQNPGIYLVAVMGGSTNTTRIDPSVFSKVTTGASGPEGKLTAIVYGGDAVVQTTVPNPIFYFILGKAKSPTGESETAGGFTLTRMDCKKSRRRITIVMNRNFFTGQMKNEDVKKSNVVPTTIDKISDGFFKVMPTGSLVDGEYCFVYTGMAPPASLGLVPGHYALAFCFGMHSGGHKRHKH